MENRVKLAIRDSCFYRQLPLSKNLQQGEYCLRAYTYNMQKQDKDWVFRKKIRMINLMDSKVWTEVSYKKEKGNYYAVVRFLDRNKEPFAQIPITYALNPKGYRFTETRIGMDRNGEVKIKVDTSDHVLRLGFYEGKPLLEDNILSNLLLTSYLKGYIKDPTYYFNDTTTILEHHLELVM